MVCHNDAANGVGIKLLRVSLFPEFLRTWRSLRKPCGSILSKKILFLLLRGLISSPYGPNVCVLYMKLDRFHAFYATTLVMSSSEVVCSKPFFVLPLFRNSVIWTSKVCTSSCELRMMCVVCYTLYFLCPERNMQPDSPW